MCHSENAESTKLAVTLGVLQGSVLGSTKFLNYIKDLPDSTTCSVNLCRWYFAVCSRTDYFFRPILTIYLHEWSRTNEMPFNTAKCEVITFNNRGCFLPSSKICDHLLNHYDKYLVVIIQSYLKFNSNVSSKVNSAKRVLGYIEYARNNAPQSAKLLTYTRCTIGQLVD